MPACITRMWVTYDFLVKSLAKCVHRVSRGAFQVARAVSVDEGLFHISEEREGLLSFVLLVSHAEDDDPVLVDVVEEELVELPRLHRVGLNARHELVANVVEVAHVAGEVAQHDIAATSLLSDECVVNRHPLFVSALAWVLLSWEMLSDCPSLIDGNGIKL